MPAAVGRLVLVCGLPGAGKTTTARRIASDIGAVRMCPDEWMIELGIDLWDEHARARIESLQWLVTTDLLRLGTNVVIEWGLWSREERDVLRTNARELGAPVELHFLVEDVDVLWERIERRQMEQRWGARPVRRGELERWVSTIEHPDVDELKLFDSPTPVRPPDGAVPAIEGTGRVRYWRGQSDAQDSSLRALMGRQRRAVDARAATPANLALRVRSAPVRWCSLRVREEGAWWDRTIRWSRSCGDTRSSRCRASGFPP